MEGNEKVVSFTEFREKTFELNMKNLKNRIQIFRQHWFELMEDEELDDGKREKIEEGLISVAKREIRDLYEKVIKTSSYSKQKIHHELRIFYNDVTKLDDVQYTLTSFTKFDEIMEEILENNM
jgi:hypothetical protein